MEMYLDLPQHLRVLVAKLRTTSHSLRIETGRYNLPAALPPDERTCWFCDDDSIEDELHLHILTWVTRVHNPLLSTESILLGVYAFERLGQIEVYFLKQTGLYLHSKFVSVALNSCRRNSMMLLQATYPQADISSQKRCQPLWQIYQNL